ncbi:Sodium/hydrogen exchanger family protein [uncultured archaeon]|nr:Sodium/hydrogen exchanger family protein [uncultured archaeon]
MQRLLVEKKTRYELEALFLFQITVMLAFVLIFGGLKKAYLPVMTILAPIYFVSIGLKTNFAANFDMTIVLLVFSVACIGKIFGAGLGAVAAGMTERKALAIGFGLNARGAMEIVLASAALVTMALATTVISGLTLPWLMKTEPNQAYSRGSGLLSSSRYTLHQLRTFNSDQYFTDKARIIIYVRYCARCRT